MNEQLVRERFEAALAQHAFEFERFFLARFFDLRISYGDETCRVEIPTAKYMFNPQGTLHGGVIALAMDVSMGHLCHRFLSTAVTLEMKLQYLRAVRGNCHCEAAFLKKGRRIVYTESRLYNEQSQLAVVATATWQRLGEERRAATT